MSQTRNAGQDEQEAAFASEQDPASKKGRKTRLSQTEDFETMSALRRTFIVVWENMALWIIGLALLGSFFMFYAHEESLLTANMILQLNYEQSADGCYPNGTRLNMNDMKSLAVAQETCALAGIEDQISANTLRNGISILPTIARGSSTSSSTFYYATSYRVSLTLPEKLQYVTTQDVLELLCEAYAHQFYSERIENSTILIETVPIDQEEYYVITDRLEKRALQLRRFLSERSAQKITESNNEYIIDFKRQLNAVDNFIAQNLEKIRAYLLQYGIARDSLDYQTTLEYKTLMENTEYKTLMAAYDANAAGLVMYDTNMSAAVLIPVKTQSGHYMSRTKSEMDYATERASGKLTDANEVFRRIEFYKSVLASLKGIRVVAARRDYAAGLIEDAALYLEELSKEIYETNQSYFLSRTRNYLSYQYWESSFTERLSIKHSALYTACIGALLALLVYLSQVAKRRKTIAPKQKGGALQ